MIPLFYTELSTSHDSHKLAGMHPFCLAVRISFNMKDFFYSNPESFNSMWSMRINICLGKEVQNTRQGCNSVTANIKISCLPI